MQCQVPMESLCTSQQNRLLQQLVEANPLRKKGVGLQLREHTVTAMEWLRTVEEFAHSRFMREEMSNPETVDASAGQAMQRAAAYPKKIWKIFFTNQVPGAVQVELCTCLTRQSALSVVESLTRDEIQSSLEIIIRSYYVQ
jgi:hypothetical protein